VVPSMAAVATARVRVRTKGRVLMLPSSGFPLVWLLVGSRPERFKGRRALGIHRLAKPINDRPVASALLDAAAWRIPTRRALRGDRYWRSAIGMTRRGALTHEPAEPFSRLKRWRLGASTQHGGVQSCGNSSSCFLVRQWRSRCFVPAPMRGKIAATDITATMTDVACRTMVGRPAARTAIIWAGMYGGASPTRNV
jgi:hypothetical protein